MKNMAFQDSLVIGKFYPLHSGHIHLIDTALANSSLGGVNVVVMGSDFESVSVSQRVRWIKNEYRSVGKRVRVFGITDNAPVDYESDIVWDAHNEIIRAALGPTLHTIDALFTSESYGNRLAAELSKMDGRTESNAIEHVCVDPDRLTYPISGTMVRPNLDQHWGSLPLSVRSDLTVRIAVVGAESTGTTTLTKSLMKHYSKSYKSMMEVEEFGRQYTYDKFNDLKFIRDSLGYTTSLSDLKWDVSDFETISKHQGRLQNTASIVSPLSIYDTDQLATSIWKDHYLGDKFKDRGPFARSAEPVELYLITDHVGIPHEDDGWRDLIAKKREDMTRNFIETLTALGKPWVFISGSDHDKRVEMSVRVIDEVIKKKHTFYSPPWADVTKIGG